MSLEPLTLTARLGSVAHFRGLPEKDLRAIVEAGHVQRFAGGEMIFLQEEHSAGMFVLLSGEVHLCKLGPQGQQHILAVVKPVIMFNEVAALDGGPNPITALAAQDCLTWRVTYPAFQELLLHYPQVGLGLLRVMAARNRLLVAHYEDLSFRSVLARTAKLLLDLSDDGQTTIQRREHSINELASRIASVPEAISRSIKELQRQGCIEASRTQIVVLDPQALAILAQVA
jgi:CRP/FNR family transcriptional regulator